MSGGHDHAPKNYDRAFGIGIGLNLIYVAVEATYGYLANSLALIADAGHNLSDVLGLVLAWGASWLARRPLTARRSYGLRRSSVLASLLNAALLLFAIGAIAIEAVQRFGDPAPIAGRTVIVVALIGIVINTGTALLFFSGRKGDLNIRGAFLHMAADAAVSAGVVLAGIVILVTDWTWLDPAISLVIVGVIFLSTWGLLRDSVNMALDATPEQIDPSAVRECLLGLPGVASLHDLHIWNLSTTEIALTVHLVMPGVADHDWLIARASQELHDRFGIEHATLQIEQGDPQYPCRLAPEDVV
jgi:cobalt-zinc-cadmium efflux system protein